MRRREPQVDIEQVVDRVERTFQNELDDDQQGTEDEARERIGKWLCGASYDEWFALVRERRTNRLLALALDLACADAADGEVQAERLATAYLRGATASLAEQDETAVTPLALRVADEEGLLVQQETRKREQASIDALRERLNTAISNSDWNNAQMQGRIDSLMLALKTVEPVLAELPRFGQSAESKKALSHVRAMFDLPQIELRKAREEP